MNLSYSDAALAAWRQHLSTHELKHYCGILSMQGASRLAKIIKSDTLMGEVKDRLRPFWSGEVENVVSVYGKTVGKCGGNASAWMVLRGALPEALDSMVRHAETLCSAQPRDKRRIFQMPGGNWKDHSDGFIFIDTVFMVCPFLLWTGLAAKRRDFIDESCFQMIKHYEILFDKSMGLYHQCVNFNIPGALSPAHWSRGNGWAAIALAEMVYDLPKEHKDHGLILQMFRELMDGCLNHQDGNGMLHQSMEDKNSYTETSGTALVLYAMGRGLKNGSLDESKFKEPFLRGLRGMTRYVALDGSVFNCCPGCCGPGTGTVADYNAKAWALNDEHAFGPVILLFSQAEQLKIVGKIPEMKDLMS
jgi:unsaturated rhamnogalacturonyl hydrolase